MPLKQKAKRAAKPTADNEPTLKKKKKSVETPAEEVEVKDLPSIEESPELKKIAEASQKAEKNAKKKENKSDTEPESEAENKKSFLSISDTANDGETPKVPSFSATKNRGVVYIGHIPHGFYERQMRQFFGQFGAVTNLRLGRSKKTGKSRGFAFVEFKYMEVAKIVAESMNNYLMFDKIMKCSVVPKERTSPAMFANKVKPSRPPGQVSRRKAKKLHNSVKCEQTVKARQKRQIKKVNKSLAKLKKAGINYEFKIAEMSG